MSAEVIQKWHLSGRPALINGVALRPVALSLDKNQPLCIQRGQAAIYLLDDATGRGWVLKKFRNVHRLTVGYLRGISQVLPNHPGFTSGLQRSLLTASSLASAAGTAYSPELAAWLQNTVLMPRVESKDWAYVADGLREAHIHLDMAVRIELCRRLTELVGLLEHAGVSHRDLSSGNVFFDLQRRTASLIDFDSVYHGSFTMPPGTTCGTSGYIAPYVWQQNGHPDAASSWRQHADRYALALLNVEILVLSVGFPLSDDGGMFDQGELRARRGKSIDLARTTLHRTFPAVVGLLDRTVESVSYDACPSPAEWSQALGAKSVGARPAPRARSQHPQPVLPLFPVLTMDRPVAIVHRPPMLFEVPPIPMVCRTTFRVVPLPPDPWKAGV
jgi:serine/threonine protein kinase